MKITELIESVKKQFNEAQVDYRMMSLPRKYASTNNGIIINKETNTELRHIAVNLQYSVPIISVYLIHNNCTRYSNNRKISSAPHFCKYCGQMPLDESNALDLGLTEKPAAAKLHIRVMGPKGYQYSGKQKFEISNMLLFEDGQWWHKCPEFSKETYDHTRLTIKKFPHKCKRCKMLLGDASFNFKTAFKLPGLV